MRSELLVAATWCVASSQVALGNDNDREFTDDFPIEDCNFVARGGNPFFDLTPGRQLYLSNQQCVAEGECDELEELWITALAETRNVVIGDGGRKREITTRVVEEKETADGELVEISRNFFATCRPSNDVYYFGEEVDIYEDGEIVSHEGEWLAGRDQAKPGIIMPDSGFLIGSRYYQELAPGVALDRAEHVEIDLKIQTPAGSFRDCIQVTETTPLEPGDESTKRYCPHIGLIADDDLLLQAVYEPKEDARKVVRLRDSKE
ncbi:hypothetical protein [Steroidobacter agaridevorans]|uniref:hypothetical protein n=1 Tax=Steroidobacter agaridevorans TaxID=2695856 RepID=UPI001321F9D4|nr:hypothetical protein [Steroidobacter agaridevorans]GFE91533.1 hypothetical protein GCM10011488_64870 [Steroidobacter agaridevorans]